MVKVKQKSTITHEIALQQICGAISILAATALLLAGCFECKPGDTRTTNHTSICGGRQ